MPQPFKLKTALAVAGLAGLASVTPMTASWAGEPMQLDTAQLDTVTAGALVGFSLLGDANAQGSIRSESRTIFNGSSTSSEVASVATGTIINTAIAVGGDSPTATTESSLGAPLDANGDPIGSGPIGTPVVILPILIQQSGPGFAFSVNALAVGYVATEVPVF